MNSVSAFCLHLVNARVLCGLLVVQCCANVVACTAGAQLLRALKVMAAESLAHSHALLSQLSDKDSVTIKLYIVIARHQSMCSIAYTHL